MSISTSKSKFYPNIDAKYDLCALLRSDFKKWTRESIYVVRYYFQPYSNFINFFLHIFEHILRPSIGLLLEDQAI